MRKFWIGVALAGLMVASAGVGAWAATGTRKNIEVEFQNIKMLVNGKEVSMGDVEPFIYVEKGRTFIPARPLAEALGATVTWNQETKTVAVSTPDFVQTTTDGEYKVWAMPGQGFSVRAPRNFVRQEVATALLQLALPDPATGANAVVAFAKADKLSETASLKDQMDLTLKATFGTVLSDAQITSQVATSTQVTVEGTANVFGKVPVSFSLRLIAGEVNNWLVTTLTPSSMQAQVSPLMKEIVESFTLTH